MKRLLAISVFVNVVMLAVVALLSKGRMEVAHAAGGGGGGSPAGNGDVNGDGTIDISDAVYTLSWLFTGGPAPVAIECPPPGRLPIDGPIGNGDVNGDRAIDISDAVYVLSSLFTGGPASEALQCLPPVTGTPLPDTGQTECYGDLEGEWIEQPCESTICTGQDGGYATGCPMDGRFVDNGDGTVTDNCTGLMWQKGYSSGSINWCMALAYCEDLNLAGHDDWRLPSLRELQSIVDYGRSGPAIDPVFEDDPVDFESQLLDFYWSSTASVNLHWWWFVNSLDGSVVAGNMKGPGPPPFVRAVRGESRLPAVGLTLCYDSNGGTVPCDSSDSCKRFGESDCSSEGRFMDNGDGTVTDNCTGLMWQKDTGMIDGRVGLAWCDALAYCEKLSFAGHDDWRLPNVRELQSIVDYGRYNPAVDPVFGAVSGWYWSSSSSAASPDSAWDVCFNGGFVGLDHKGVLYFFRAVRSGP